MISVSEAAGIIDRQTPTLPMETISIDECLGRVLAEPIVADTDLPPFDRSQMDGYAVVAADTADVPARLKIVGESAAGRGWHDVMKPGEAVRIMTGAPVPNGADAVQKLEVAAERDGWVTLTEPTEPERYIIRKGSEIREGATLIEPGGRIDANNIAVLAAFGYSAALVAARPRVAILGTGSEIVEIAETPGRDQIRNSNSIMLDALCRIHGGVPRILPNVKDEISDLKFQISEAAKTSDMLVMTGGVSVGKYDHTKTALDELDAEVYFEKIRLKPGKPAVFANLGGTLIFGLPGNPVSAAVTFHLFVRRALLKMQGATPELRTGRAIVAGSAKAARERDTYVPARLETTEDGHLAIHPLRWSGSSDFVGYARADSLIVLPLGTKASDGEVVDFVYL